MKCLAQRPSGHGVERGAIQPIDMRGGRGDGTDGPFARRAVPYNEARGTRRVVPDHDVIGAMTPDVARAIGRRRWQGRRNVPPPRRLGKPYGLELQHASSVARTRAGNGVRDGGSAVDGGNFEAGRIQPVLRQPRAGAVAAKGASGIQGATECLVASTFDDG